MKIDKMQIAVFQSNQNLGQQAAADFAQIVKQTVAERGEAAVIFATGNSQLSFFEGLHAHPDIPWNAIVALHMDEYLGMSDAHPASFRRFLNNKVTAPFHPRQTFGIHGDAPDKEAELARYTELLQTYQPIITVLGIGENGHLAFNDPPADFNTKKLIHVVTLDETCRRQQVGEGHFSSLEDVPHQAISLTIPALLRPAHVMALVPEGRKAQAVKAALEGPITENCPASILRTQPHVKLYLDEDSAALIKRPVQN